MPIDKNIEDLELNDLDTDTIAIDDLDDISEVENSEIDSIDLDISEIESNSFSQESNDGDTSLLNIDMNGLKDEKVESKVDNIEELKEEKIKIDSDIDLNLDFDSIGEEEKFSNVGSLETSDDTEEIDLSLEESFKEIDNEITQSYKKTESEFDIKSDLGLEDELSLDLDENNNIDENFDLDITDDMGNKIDSSEDEFGVDLKSGPITIDFFGEKGKTEDFDDTSDTIIDFDELDEKISKDEDVLKLNIPEKKPLTLDEDQTKYLEQEIDEEKIDINLEDNFEDIDKELKEFNIEGEEIDNLSLENLEDEALKRSESLVTDDELENLEIESEKELDLSFDNIDTEEIEEATLADDEIKIDNTQNIEESNEENLNFEYDSNITTSELDKEEINLTEIGLEEEKDEEKFSEEKIMLDETELSEVEEVIFPDDKNMPELDEEIKSVGLNESTLTDSISPLTDTDIVFSEEIGGNNLEEDQSEKIELSLDEEIEDESLSPTELDNIINTTELIETPAEEILEENLEEEKIKLDDNEMIIEGLESIGEENLELEEVGVDIKEEPQTIEESMESETIDLSNFEAELVDTKEEEVQTLNISKEEEEDIYNSLRDKMESKKKEDPKELKDQVKLVLSYLDQLLDSLPEEKIKEFAESKTFEIYRKLFEELKIKS